jgi:hypothetical protein
MDQYSKNLNDYGTYLSPLGTMLCTGLSGSGVNTVSSAVSVVINQLGLKSTDFLEKNKSLVNRSVGVLAAIIVTTVAQPHVSGSSNSNFAVTCLANLGLFIAASKTVEAINPARIIPYVRLPATVAVSCLVGEVARIGLLALGASAQEINQIGGFLTMLAVCSVALNDLVYSKTETVIVRDDTPRPQILKNVDKQVRQLSDGRLLILPNKK